MSSAALVEAPPADAGSWYASVGAEALAVIGFPWQERLPGWNIGFLPAREGLLGGTWTKERRIEIYVRPGQCAEEVAFTIAHEIAHALDVTHNNRARRRRWLEARGIELGETWWAQPGEPDFETGAGDFAESFAVWQVGERVCQSQSKWGPPTGDQLRLLAALTA